MKRRFFTRAALKAEERFEAQDMRGYYESLEAFGPKPTTYTPGKQARWGTLKSKQGDVVYTTTADKLTRFREHCIPLLNQESTVHPDIDARLPKQQHERSALDFVFTMEEMMQSFEAMDTHKSPGADDIPIEVEKFTKPSNYRSALLDFYNDFLEKGYVPGQLKDAIIIMLHKSGAMDECDNYRGIALIAHLGKVLERMINNRLLQAAIDSGIIPDYQYGFMHDRSTSDGILLVKFLMRWAQDNNIPLQLCFIDLIKAYDTVHRETLWKILRRIGIPPKLVELIRQMHEGAQAKVRIDGELSEPFMLKNGLKQGSVLSPLLFNIYMGAIMANVERRYNEEQLGIQLEYHPANHIFETQHRTAVGEAPPANIRRRIRSALYADDLVNGAVGTPQTQRMLDIFIEEAIAFGLDGSFKKTEVMIVGYTPPKISKPPEGPVQEVVLEAVVTMEEQGSSARPEKPISTMAQAATSGLDVMEEDGEETGGGGGTIGEEEEGEETGEGRVGMEAGCGEEMEGEREERVERRYDTEEEQDQLHPAEGGVGDMVEGGEGMEIGGQIIGGGDIGEATEDSRYIFTLQGKDGVRRRIKVTGLFPYLGSQIRSTATLTAEIATRLARMDRAYKRFAPRHFENPHVGMWAKDSAL